MSRAKESGEKIERTKLSHTKFSLAWLSEVDVRRNFFPKFPTTLFFNTKSLFFSPVQKNEWTFTYNDQKIKKTTIKAFYHEWKLAVNENFVFSLYSSRCSIKAIQFTKFSFFYRIKQFFSNTVQYNFLCLEQISGEKIERTDFWQI